MFNNLIEKFKTTKVEYLSRSPKGKWEFVRNTGIFILRCTGVPVLDPNFKVYWWSYAATGVILDVTFSFIYSVWYFNFMEKDPVKGLFNIPLYFGILIPVALNYLMVMIPSQMKMYQSLAFFSGDKIYTDINEHSNMGYIRVCDNSALKLLKTTAITIMIIVVSMNIYVGFPITSSMFTGVLQLPIPVYLPFTDYTTDYGVILNIGNNIFVGVVGLAGNVGVEIITSMLKNTVYVCTATIGYSVHEITILLENHEQKVTRIINHQFRNTLVQIQDLDR